MAASSYPESIRRLLKSEGGYVNHPADPGGPTNFGVTIADYRRYVKRDATAADVRAMQQATAVAIYKPKYWDAIKCDSLPAGVDYCEFDYAVNSGTGRAPKVLQRVLGLPASGRVDDATLRAAAKVDAGRLINAICDERLRFLKGLKTWPVFGAGWSRRVSEVRAAALAMAAHAALAPVSDAPSIVPQVPAAVPDPAPSAGKGQVAASPVTSGVVTKTAGGGLVGALGTAWDWVCANPAEAAVIAALAGIAAYGLIHLLAAWHRRAQEAPAPFQLVTA